MGSVIDYIECPNCGQPNCTSDFYYKSGEEYVQCTDCGYYKSIEIKIGSRKKNFSDLTEEDWEIDEISNPYGAFRAKLKKSIVYTCGSISSKEHFDHIISNLNEEIDEFTLSRFINGKIVTMDILRKIKLEKLKRGIK